MLAHHSNTVFLSGAISKECLLSLLYDYNRQALSQSNNVIFWPGNLPPVLSSQQSTSTVCWATITVQYFPGDTPHSVVIIPRKFCPSPDVPTDNKNSMLQCALFLCYLLDLYLNRTHESFTYKVAASDMVGGNWAVPKGKPWPFAGCCQTFPLMARGRQHELHLNSQWLHLWQTVDPRAYHANRLRLPSVCRWHI